MAAAMGIYIILGNRGYAELHITARPSLSSDHAICSSCLPSGLQPARQSIVPQIVNEISVSGRCAYYFVDRFLELVSGRYARPQLGWECRDQGWTQIGSLLC